MRHEYIMIVWLLNNLNNMHALIYKAQALQLFNPFCSPICYVVYIFCVEIGSEFDQKWKISIAEKNHNSHSDFI